MSPQEYMIDVRLENAKRLLGKTNHSCTDIAYICGFSNGAQMTSMFKKKYGKTPKEFKITD
jgi:transcriptional regulator GlxA family with amidase domain